MTCGCTTYSLKKYPCSHICEMYGDMCVRPCIPGGFKVHHSFLQLVLVQVKVGKWRNSAFLAEKHCWATSEACHPVADFWPRPWQRNPPCGPPCIARSILNCAESNPAELRGAVTRVRPFFCSTSHCSVREVREFPQASESCLSRPTKSGRWRPSALLSAPAGVPVQKRRVVD